MLRFCSLVDRSALLKDSLAYPAVSLDRGQEVDSAMAVLVVVPMDKLLAPLSRLIEVIEAFRLIIAVVLQGFEETLRIGLSLLTRGRLFDG